MLEKILEEIIEQLKTEGCIVDDDAGNRAEEIIRKHMNDGWIPVEERLPEENITCLVTVEYSGFMRMYGTWVTWFKTAHTEKNSGEWWGDGTGGKIIAWQPFPEPYRPEKGEEE